MAILRSCSDTVATGTASATARRCCCKRIRKLQPGDIISYRWGRAKYAHLAIYLGDKRILHCQARNGVEITDIDAPYLFDAKGKSRVTGYWRVKEQ